MVNCIICGDKQFQNKYPLCEKHVKFYIYVLPLKIKVLDLLGWKCDCCGFDGFHFLMVDHKNPLNKEKRHLNTAILYNYVLTNPEKSKDEFQIYCWSCNNSKKRGSKCTIDHVNFKNREDIINWIKSLNLPQIKRTGHYKYKDLI